jgi:hypothetical protein
MRNLGYRLIVDIKQLEEHTFARRQTVERTAKQSDAALAVEIQLEGRPVSDKTFFDSIQILGQSTAPPMISDRVINDLHQQSAGIRNFVDAMKSFNSAQRDILLEILVMDRRAGSFRRNMNESADLRRIKFHVTVFLDVRQYLA